jgi:hypothetical protein
MAVRESPAGKPVAGAAAQRPGPGPRAGPDGEPGRTASRATPVRVTAGLDPATAAELDAGWAVPRSRPARLPAAKAIHAMIRAAAASTAVTSAVIAQLCLGQGLGMP